MLRKRLAAAAAALLLLFPAGAGAYDTVNTRVVDDFGRDWLGVDKPGETGSGPFDESWLHNPDGYGIYWIQYNPDTFPSVQDGALKLEIPEVNGWYGFGMVADFKDPSYDSVIIRLKGEQGGEEALLYFNIQGLYALNWENARDPDGNPLPPVTTEYQDFVISLENSGMGGTKAQSNILAGGWSDFHINSNGPLTVYIDSIRQLQTRKLAGPDATEPPEQDGPPPTPEPTPSPAPSPAPVPDDEAKYPPTDRDLRNSFLVDDFNRASLMMDPELEIAPGGEFGRPNSDGSVIYWISFNDATEPVIENGALRLTATGAGWYGTATDLAFLDEYNCIAFRIRGELGGEEEILSFNPDVQGGKRFSELTGPDGKPVPPITTEWQTIVIDLERSGWPGLADGKETYQNIHLNTSGPLTVYIDEIYFVSDGASDVFSPAAPTASPAALSPTAAPTPSPTPSPSGGGGENRVILIVGLAVVLVGAAAGVVVLVTRKK